MSKEDEYTKERLLIFITHENARVVTQSTINSFNVIEVYHISGCTSKGQANPVSSDFKDG